MSDIKNIRAGDRLNYYTYMAILLGVFIGSLLYLILFHNNIFLFEDGLENYNISGVNSLSCSQLIFYVFRRRTGQILLYSCLVFIFSYAGVTSIFCFSFGAYYGIAVCSFLLKFGLNSLLYLNFCFFPHFILYFISIYYFGKWFFVKMNNYYLDNSYVKKLTFFVKLFVIISFILIGLLWEGYFQKIILNFFYQYLVQ